MVSEGLKTIIQGTLCDLKEQPAAKDCREPGNAPFNHMPFSVYIYFFIFLLCETPNNKDLQYSLYKALVNQIQWNLIETRFVV